MCDFERDLQMSLSACSLEEDGDVLHRWFAPYCAKVQKTDKKLDKTGIDYIVTLVGGARINIDVKMRRVLNRMVDGEVPLALETWSCMPNAKRPNGKIGWTLNDSTSVHYILYKFNKANTNLYYLLPFQLLKQAFRKYGNEWGRKYPRTEQQNRGYYSQAVFVPASVVLKAIQAMMVCRRATA